MQEHEPIAPTRVVLGMSGGVDSSAAALLLKEQGYDVVGVTLKLWEYGEDAGSGKCCTPEDVRDARKVAFELDVPFYVRDYTKKFEHDIVDYFTAEYLEGRTPNPCAVCNDKIKFALLQELADSVKGSLLATGHYVRKAFDQEAGEFQLKRGVDASRDQTYFLFQLKQPQLKDLLFPLGDLTKKEAREVLRKYGVAGADKAESREICFVADKSYASFVASRVEPNLLKAGTVETKEGTVLGHHDGIHQFTVGQRKGLGIAARNPLYVTEIDASKNRVLVGSKDDALKEGVWVERITWMLPSKQHHTDFEVQIRYRGKPIAATVADKRGDALFLQFKQGRHVPSPGQAAVFYDGETVLGGGWITTEPNASDKVNASTLNPYKSL